jgi:outer membrane receptor for ferrienterochelin and colicin
MEKSFEEEITVTGSLIPRPSTEAMSPVATVDPEEITYTGIMRLEDLALQMPQLVSYQNTTVANGASGTATIQLRNMGVARTLVLINGRRTAPGDAFQVAPDLNSRHRLHRGQGRHFVQRRPAQQQQRDRGGDERRGWLPVPVRQHRRR